MHFFFTSTFFIPVICLEEIREGDLDVCDSKLQKGVVVFIQNVEGEKRKLCYIIRFMLEVCELPCV